MLGSKTRTFGPRSGDDMRAVVTETASLGVPARAVVATTPRGTAAVSAPTTARSAAFVLIP
jgi:hypothetical protein